MSTAVREAQRRTTSLHGHRLPAVGANAHQAHVRVGDVEVVKVNMKPRAAQQPAARALCSDRREVGECGATVLGVARTVREGRPPGTLAAGRGRPRC